MTLKPDVIKRTFNKQQEEIHDLFNRSYNAQYLAAQFGQCVAYCQRFVNVTY
ncbi:hypothetical protein [Pseudoalteromonas rubra]|uniref:hypothetical protein n=1 Tax=Pseudoalteromonas rubra TaxID=43658 RepID=UPI0014871364|nr:hypothetical protein [Pseudoalteromonas rubra]